LRTLLIAGADVKMRARFPITERLKQCYYAENAPLLPGFVVEEENETAEKTIADIDEVSIAPVPPNEEEEVVKFDGGGQDQTNSTTGRTTQPESNPTQTLFAVNGAPNSAGTTAGFASGRRPPDPEDDDGSENGSDDLSRGRRGRGKSSRRRGGRDESTLSSRTRPGLDERQRRRHLFPCTAIRKTSWQ
jgi:hypothetical protein